ncbi:S-adenosyl-L-methionine-dependent methyltransferase [Sporodiniella umbellata]|nr:S-adenosyl-L-methionine-dependent methyltransferase [Sporodiniella umbellata]
MGSQASKVVSNNKKKQEKVEPPTPSSRRSSITEFFTKRKQSIASIMRKEQDMKEQDRQQREHYLLKLARKGNTWTSLDSPRVIVEVGIGNGIWALEMATQYPQSQLIGLDKKLPDMSLSNQTFHCVNVLKTWPIEDNTADFIFQRNMISCIQQDQWIHLLKEMLRVIRPGGCIELLEPELLHHRPGPVLQAFHVFYKEQCTEANLDIELNQMEEWLRLAGFESIEKRTLDLPIGEWQTETGA